jgi:hypothetical protein
MKNKFLANAQTKGLCENFSPSFSINRLINYLQTVSQTKPHAMLSGLVPMNNPSEAFR